MVCSSVVPGGLPEEVNPSEMRRRPIPGGLAVEPSPREVRRRRRRLEEGARPTHNRLIAPGKRNDQVEDTNKLKAKRNMYLKTQTKAVLTRDERLFWGIQ